MIIASQLTAGLVSASAASLAMPSLEDWTHALLEVEPHPLEGDGQQAMAFLSPMLEDLGRPDLADRFLESDGAQAWVHEPENSRIRLMHRLVSRFSAENVMSLRMETTWLRNSVGRDRPVSLAVFGELNRMEPESWRILDMEFPHLRGLGFYLEIPARARPRDTHRAYFANRHGSWPRDHAFVDFTPLSPFEPLTLGKLKVGGINAVDLSSDLELRYSNVSPVDVLIIGGAVIDDPDRFEQLAALFGTKLIVAHYDGLKDSFVDDLGASKFLALSPASKNYLILAYDPKRGRLQTEIHKTQGEGVSYRDSLRMDGS